ncbi:hypothetical protein ACFP81_03435 [Deinococcus lacus]|uniref:Uncharacterized protein n=1 Tax=Deinococcus lacus TaxID=392561 RepID=A0ABW1YAF4_9DEIO
MSQRPSTHIWALTRWLWQEHARRGLNPEIAALLVGFAVLGRPESWETARALVLLVALLIAQLVTWRLVSANSSLRAVHWFLALGRSSFDLAVWLCATLVAAACAVLLTLAAQAQLSGWGHCHSCLIYWPRRVWEPERHCLACGFSLPLCLAWQLPS